MKTKINSYTPYKLLTFIALVIFSFGVVFSFVSAQTLYQNYTPRTQSETIAYLQGVIAQLRAQLSIQQQSGNYVYTGSGSIYSTVRYEVDAGTGFISYDEDDMRLNGTINLGGAPYAYVWFEYSEGDDDFNERTSRRTVSSNGYFNADFEDLDNEEIYYYRAVAESPSGRRDYGVTRSVYVTRWNVSSRSNNNNDEPDAETERAGDIDENSAELNGEIDMNDFKNGTVFFVYGEDEDQIEDVERDYDSYRDVDEDDDDLQKVRVDLDLDGEDTYRRTVSNLDDDTDHYFQICVEYEDEDDDDALECGGVEDFETDRD